MRDIEERCLTRGEWHGEWNRTLLARPRPAPEPGPAPARGPDPALLTSLAALAGIPDPGALCAAGSLDWEAAREHRLTLARGRDARMNNSGGKPW